MIVQEIWYRCTDGKTFKNKGDAETWQGNLNRVTLSETQIRKLVYKNLWDHMDKNLLSKSYPRDEVVNMGDEIFNYLIDNKKEVLLLLTCGNLETKYTQRGFVKPEAAV